MAARQSVWARSMPVKEQLTVIRRLLPYAKPFKWFFIAAIVFSGLISVVNIYLPRVLQTFIDHYLKTGHATVPVMWYFAGLYFFGMVVRALMQFVQNFSSTMGQNICLKMSADKCSPSCIGWACATLIKSLVAQFCHA